MITAVHTLIYSDDAEATRAFLRDVLGFPFVDDGGSGWLIFGTGPSEAGVHPTHTEWEGKTHDSPRKHVISFMCDDVAATRAELEAKGVTIARNLVGNYITSLDMTGCSLTILRATDDMLKLWDAPVRTPGLRWGV